MIWLLLPLYFLIGSVISVFFYVDSRTSGQSESYANSEASKVTILWPLFILAFVFVGPGMLAELIYKRQVASRTKEKEKCTCRSTTPTKKAL